jgi:hypothetical protein
LVDRYIQKEIQIDLNGETRYDFAVGDDVKSAATNRFYVVFCSKESCVDLSQPISTIQENIKVFPNPIQNKTIQFEFSGKLNTFYNLEVRSAVGQLIQTGSIIQEASKSNFSLKMPETAAKGLYIISVFGRDGAVTRSKFILK